MGYPHNHSFLFGIFPNQPACGYPMTMEPPFLERPPGYRALVERPASVRVQGPLAEFSSGWAVLLGICARVKHRIII